MAEKINYELDTLLLKQKKLLVLDIQTGFFFRMKKKPVISYTGNFFCFNSNVSNFIKITLKKGQSFKTFIKLGTWAQVA
jgi:hypothetical protein